MADLKISQLTAATTPLAGTEVLPIVQNGATTKVSVADLTSGRAVSAASLTASGNVRGSTVWSIAASGTNGVTIGDFGTDAGTFRISATSGRNLEFINDYAGVQDAKFDANGNFQFTRGNLVQGTAAKGINFTANTPAAGMTSQLLNAYEEGTWTVTLTPGTSGTIGLYPTFDECQYTRIGRMMFVSGQIKILSTSSPVGTYVRMSLPSFVADLPEIAGRMGATVSKSNAVYAALAVEGANYIDIQTSAAGFTVDEIVAFSFAYVTA